MKTIFERIIDREIPSHIIYEDDLVIAFLDISQVTKGHTLVATKVAYPNIFNIPSDVLGHLYMVSQKICFALNLSFKTDAINVINNNGELAGQTIFHFHIHLIPRYKNDNFVITHDNNMGKITTEEYENRANLIRSALL